MKSSTKDQAEGTFHELKGKVKEIAGKLSDNRRWKRKAPVKRSPAKFRERSARSEGVGEVAGTAWLAMNAAGVREEVTKKCYGP